MEKTHKIPCEDLKIEWARPSNDLRDETCFVRLTHRPTGKVGIGDDYIGGCQVVRRKNLNIAYRKLLKAIDQEEENGQ